MLNKKIQEKRKALHKKYKGERCAGKAQLTDAQKAEIKKMREQQKQLHQAAAAIALKYKTQLGRIKESIADERATWEADLKAIAIKYNPELADKSLDETKRGHHAAKLARYNRLIVPVNFILWDATQDRDVFIEPGSTVYPNPTSSTNTIEYIVAKNGNVKITQLDAKGNALRTLLNEPKAKGHYTLDVNLNNLPNATYYYIIETASGSETKRILKR
ncbi:hypothetical protein ABID22_003676 [Pontibacter aydingkolensis]|uniref:T9SS type A sorting domain-containing protein n=1 Tax=Pontibacter aydingkolensis TaxID=1911536 RepID=A0ABS7CZ63_9BACT|nr:T9SS type A sorting domain-containing protein [Pontibacter aydingkolensis]MBW7468976.1 T9SS type A sorting domain-containing protein [Pontibacter aydingkolensis]